MLKSEVIKIDKTVTYRLCDYCNTNIDHQVYSKLRCEMCDKDLCSDCIGHENTTYGDVREVYCKPCWEKGIKYLSEIKTLEDKIEQLNDEWRKECND